MIEFLLEEAFKKNSCPICKTVEEQMRDFFFWFERESYHEYSSIKTLFEHSCICKKHKEQIISLKDKLNNTFELMIELEIKQLKKLENSKKPLKIAKSISTDCRFCLEEKRIETHAIETMLNSKDSLEKYLNSPSLLCKKHLLLVLKRVNNPDISREMIKKTISILDEAHKRIENYFKKIDYTSKEKPSQDEINAYLDALKYFSTE